MLRRLSLSPRCITRALVMSYFTASPSCLQSTSADASVSSHSAATATTATATATAAAASGTQQRGRRPSLAQQRARRLQLPPAFDIVHWNDEDIARGHLLRVLHRDSFVVLDYHRQAKKTTEEGNKADHAVSVMLPAVYIARFLSVLEGRAEKVEVQSRFTNAVFAPVEKVAHTYKLVCKSTRPQQQRGDGEEETLEWTVEFDPAESLMLHRFLSQALHYNTGFARTTI